MKEKKNKNESKRSNPSSSKSQAGTGIRNKETFNTGSHTPTKLRNVGPGYDDTGLGDYKKSKEAIPGTSKHQGKVKQRKAGKD